LISIPTVGLDAERHRTQRLRLMVKLESHIGKCKERIAASEI